MRILAAALALGAAGAVAPAAARSPASARAPLDVRPAFAAVAAGGRIAFRAASGEPVR
jgi:hypothetical protein